MTVANLNIGKQKFVVIPRKDFDRLRQADAALQRLVKEDAALGRLADQELRAFRTSCRSRRRHEGV